MAIKVGTLVVSKQNAYTLYRIIKVNLESYDIEVVDKSLTKKIVYHGQPKNLFIKWDKNINKELDYNEQE